MDILAPYKPLQYLLNHLSQPDLGAGRLVRQSELSLTVDQKLRNGDLQAAFDFLAKSLRSSAATMAWIPSVDQRQLSRPPYLVRLLERPSRMGIGLVLPTRETDKLVVPDVFRIHRPPALAIHPIRLLRPSASPEILECYPAGEDPPSRDDLDQKLNFLASLLGLDFFAGPVAEGHYNPHPSLALGAKFCFPLGDMASNYAYPLLLLLFGKGVEAHVRTGWWSQAAVPRYEWFGDATKTREFLRLAHAKLFDVSWFEKVREDLGPCRDPVIRRDVTGVLAHCAFFMERAVELMSLTLSPTMRRLLPEPLEETGQKLGSLRQQWNNYTPRFVRVRRTRWLSIARFPDPNVPRKSS